MSIEHVFHCDAPECERHVRSQSARPPIFVTATKDDEVLHFCTWDCVLRYAATMEPETIIPGPVAQD